MTPDWRAIGDAIHDAEGAPVALEHRRAVGGGSIHETWLIGEGTRRYFVKTGNAASASMFEAEAAGLGAIATTKSIVTPRVVVHGGSAASAFLVLEALELSPLDAAGGARLGESLAFLHRTQGAVHGWTADNFIGLTPQHNLEHASWPHFFADRRLRPQLALAGQNGMDAPWVRKGEEIAERIGALFLDYRPPPSLLHGDLWSGNAGQLPDGRPAVFDPACYRGDRETDIAMAELFGGFPTSFLTAYRKAWPLDKGYEQRKPLYNLYHILNHFNLFGGAYLGQAQRMIAALSATLKR